MPKLQFGNKTTWALKHELKRPLEHQVDQHHVRRGAGEDGKAGAALPGMEGKREGPGDESGRKAVGDGSVVGDGGEGVDDQDGHDTNGHGGAEEIDERAAFEEAEEGEGKGAQQNGDDGHGDEHRGDHR